MKLTIEQLKNKYPATYLAAIDEGVQHGITKARDEIAALLPKSSPLERNRFMLKCIRDGVELTPKINATYSVMQMKEFRQVKSAEAQDAELAAALEEVMNVGRH